MSTPRQPHQVVIIARVGQHHQRLAAVHRHASDGLSAVLACDTLIKLFSNPKNRIGLQQELVFAKHYYKDHHVPGGYQTVQHYSPFPFIATILLVGATVDPEHGRTHPGVEPIYFDVLSSNAYDFSKSLGVTLLDITALEDIRYGFVDLRNLPMPPSGAPVNTPSHKQLSAWSYIASGHRSEDIRDAGEWRHHLAELDAMELRPLVTTSALRSAFPNGAWAQVEECQSQGLMGAAPLLLMAVRNSIDAALDAQAGEFDPFTMLEQPMGIPGFQAAMREYLCSEADNITSHRKSNLVPLLQLAFAGERHVNLSHFTKLSISDVKLILHHPSVSGSVSVVSFPVMASFSATEVADALPPTGVAELYTLGSDGSTAGESFSALWLSGCVTQRLVNFQMFSAGMYPRSCRPWISWRHYEPPSLPSGQVLQFVVVAPPRRRTNQNLALTPMQQRQNLPRMAALYLGDALLSPQRFVEGLFNYLRFLLPGGGSGGRLNDPNLAAFAFASGDGGISPLPVELIRTGTDILVHNSVTSRAIHADNVRDMSQGSWTGLLYQAHVPGTHGTPDHFLFQLGFIRPRTFISGRGGFEGIRQGDFDLFGLKEYMECVQPGSGEWLNGTVKSFSDYLAAYGTNTPVVLQSLGEEDALECLRNATAVEPGSMDWMNGKWLGNTPMLDTW